MKLQSSLDVLLLCNGESLMKSIVCSQLKWKNFLCHLCMLSIYQFIIIHCILQFKKKKKREWHKITSLLFMLVGCSITLVFDIYIYISAILTFGVWLMFLLFFSDRGESKQESIRGTLHYLFEGVMPFLQVNVHWDRPDLCQNTYTCFPKAAILIYRLKL